MNSVKEYYANEGSVISDKNGQVIFDYRQRTKKQIVALDKIPEIMKYAILVREDENLYKSSGLSWKNFSGALLGCIRSKLTGINADCRGGSGIYQQLIKNYDKLPNRDVETKYNEVLKSIKLSEEINPDQAVELYLNNMDFGRLSKGVQVGAQSFFGHGIDSPEMNPSKACFLSIMPNQPTGFTVATRNMINGVPDLDSRLTYRWSYVRTLLENCIDKLSKIAVYPNKPQAITYQEATKWKNYDITANIKKESIDPNSQSKYYIKDYIEEELLRLLPDTFPTRQTLEDSLNNKKMNIITTIDLDVQNKIEKTAQTNKTNLLSNGINQFSSAVVNTNDSKLIAILGNLDYTKSQVNRLAGDYGYILPGSSTKPYYFAAALDRGFNPSTILSDGSYIDPVIGTIRSNDQAGVYSGPVTLRYGLQQSLNTIAEQVMYINQEGDNFAFKKGVKNSVSFAQSLGLKFQNPDSNKNCIETVLVALGSCPVNGLSHLNSFATLANKGVNSPIQVIDKVLIDQKSYINRETLNDKFSKPQQVINASIANQTINILSDYNTRRTPNSPRSLDAINYEMSNWTGSNQVAAKSGTAQILYNGSNQAGELTMIGASPKYTTLIWGANVDDKLNKIPTKIGSNGITPIYKQIVETIHENITPRPFELNGLTSVSLNQYTGLLDSSSTYKELLTDLQLEALRQSNSFNTNIFSSRTTVDSRTCKSISLFDNIRFVELANYINTSFNVKC
jgi:membrane peptidoglycan carboxypeptidase